MVLLAHVRPLQLEKGVTNSVFVTAYSHFDYGELYSDAAGSFHHCGLTADDNIVSYNSREQVQECQLSSLAE
jgi:hypothetical protein